MTRVIGLLLLMLTGGCVATAVLAPAPAPVSASGKRISPVSALVFEPAELDMGSVREGTSAKAVLRLRNSGQQMLEIADVQASCGCTTAVPQERVLMPGDFTLLNVTIDTFAKQENVKKWVQVTDSFGRVSRATLHLRVIPNPHMALSGRSIFDKPCASCHADPARGKQTGAAIYAAVCAMCHGGKGQGAYAPKLAGHRDAGVLRTLVANGTGGQYMPGFARHNGGPLDAQQISALSAWLVSLDD